MPDEVKLIDRDEVGAKIQAMYIRREIDYGGENEFCRGMRKALRIIEDAPTVEVQPDNGWISVKDRLPEPRTWVLAYIEYPSPVFELERGIHKTGNIRKMFYDGFYDALGDYKVGDCKVTHWMPLPKPPKGEE